MTDFSQFVRYSCRHCGAECINRIEEKPTRTKECRDCFRESSIHTLDPITHHLPDSQPDDSRDVPRAE